METQSHLILTTLLQSNHCPHLPERENEVQIVITSKKKDQSGDSPTSDFKICKISTISLCSSAKLTGVDPHSNL